MTAPSIEFPDLLDLLKQQFTLTPNYDRPLSDRIVDRRFDPATGAMRPVTEREYVERHYWGGSGGPHLRQVWAFTVDGVRLQFNDAFEHWTNHGIQYASGCAACGETVWNNADRGPQPLCRQCRSCSGWCSETKRTCAAAYTSRKNPCRCPTCRAWNAAKHRQLRAQRTHNRVFRESKKKSKETLGIDGSFPGKNRFPKNPVMREETGFPLLDGWGVATWLPEPVRDVLERYEADLTAAWASRGVGY